MIAHKPIVLLTRPQAQADAVIDDLKAAGYEVISSPMLQIENLSYSAPDLSRYDGLIFTSVNAVRAFTPDKAAQSMPVFCVGEKTREHLCNAGYKTIVNASRNIDMMETVMRDHRGRYLHPCGVDVVRRMDVKGVDVKALPVYKAHKVEKLTAEAEERLAHGEIECVLFYSARTGQAFVEAVHDADCTLSLKVTKALCLSDLVVNSIRKLPWQSVHVSETPDHDAMMSALRGVLSN